MRWFFEGTSTPYSEAILEELLSGSRAYVPVLCLYEVISVLAKTQRSGPTTAERAHGFLEDLRSLDIVIDEEEVGNTLGDVYRIAVEQRLSGHDASYLELAVRKQLPLASLDDDLNKAASAAGVALIGV